MSINGDTEFRARSLCRASLFVDQNLDTMLIKTPDLIEAMIELACSRRWLQSTIFVIEFSQHVLQGLWLKDSSLLQVCARMTASSQESPALLSFPPPDTMYKYKATGRQRVCFRGGRASPRKYRSFRWYDACLRAQRG